MLQNRKSSCSSLATALHGNLAKCGRKKKANPPRSATFIKCLNRDGTNEWLPGAKGSIRPLLRLGMENNLFILNRPAFKMVAVKDKRSTRMRGHKLLMVAFPSRVAVAVIGVDGIASTTSNDSKQPPRQHDRKVSHKSSFLCDDGRHRRRRPAQEIRIWP